MAGLLRQLFKRFNPSSEKWALSNSRLMTYFTSGNALPSALEFCELTEKAFRQNAIVHACIRKISQSIAEPQLKAITVMPDGQIVTNTSLEGDPLARLLLHPNEEQDQYELFEQLLIHLMIAGNAFLFKVRPPSGGPPVMLELIRPDMMTIIPGKNREEGRIKEYAVRNGSDIIPIAKRDIIHFKLPDALDEYWGLSPLYTAMRYVDIDLESSDFLRAYFKNRGIPSGLLTLDKRSPRAERERLRDLWKEHFQGREEWHNVAVLDANATYTPLATGVENMNLSPVTSQTESRICMIFGIPPALVGTLLGLHESSYSSLESSERIFWSDTMAPMFSRLTRRLTSKLAIEEFGDNRQAVFDLSMVVALTESKVEIRKIALQGWRYGLLKRNQAQKILGLIQEDPSGDVYNQSNNSTIIPSDTPPSEPQDTPL